MHVRFPRWLPIPLAGLVGALSACGGGGTDTAAQNAAPTQVALLAVTSAAIGQLHVTWQAASDDQTPAGQLRYRLYASTEAGFVPDAGTLVYQGTQALATDLTGLVPGATYHLRLLVLDGADAATPSAQVDARVAAPLQPDTGITAEQCYGSGGGPLQSCTGSSALALHSGQDGMRTPAALGLGYLPVAQAGGGHHALTECVQDTITGLMWEGKPATGSRAAGLTYTAHGDGRSGDASSYVDSVNAAQLCGYSDWRLPTRQELLGLVDFSVPAPGPTLAGAMFAGSVAGRYWSATPYAWSSASVWQVDFADGTSAITYRTVAGPVRLVRGSRPPATPRWAYSGDGGEVSDADTGLVWRRCSEGMGWDGSQCTGSPVTYTHEQALALAQTQSGWRLPSIKELSSLIDDSRVSPAIDTTAFPGTAGAGYWSSTPYVGSPGFAHGVNYGNGRGEVYYRTTDRSRVRLVRGEGISL